MMVGLVRFVRYMLAVLAIVVYSTIGFALTILCAALVYLRSWPRFVAAAWQTRKGKIKVENKPQPPAETRPARPSDPQPPDVAIFTGRWGNC